MLFPKPIQAIRQRLNQLEVSNLQTAELICRIIPGRCPFERTLQFGRYYLQIPALCKLNPFYEQCLLLRCKALIYLDRQE